MFSSTAANRCRYSDKCMVNNNAQRFAVRIRPSFSVKSSTSFGRPIWLKLTGGNGKTMDIRAESLRLALLFYRIGRPPKLRSMNCRIEDRGDTIVFSDGRGFGHSVGLCQWGAQAKAAAGWTGEQILDFYYPGAKRFRVY